MGTNMARKMIHYFIEENLLSGGEVGNYLMQQMDRIQMFKYGKAFQADNIVLDKKPERLLHFWKP